MRLKGEEAIVAFGEIMEPAAKIFGDKEIAKTYEENIYTAISIACKKYAKDIMAIGATLNGESEEEYAEKVNILTLPTSIINFVNSEEGQILFQSQGLRKGEQPSGSAMENTKE